MARVETVGAGSRSRRVSIQSSTAIRSPTTGEASRTWTTYATRWARISPMTGSERWRAQQVQPEVSHKVTLRYDAQLSSMSPKHRILFGSRVMEILAIINKDEANAELECLCKEHL